MDDTAINYERFFQQLLEVSSRPMLIVDCSLTICFYNQRAVQLLQTKEPMQGSALGSLLHEERILQLVSESIGSSRACSTEYNKDNGDVIWNVSVSPLAHSGEPGSRAYKYFAVSIENLTELRRMEHVRRDFIANISHELRTPLASVRLLVETLEDAIDTDREKAQMFVEKIETEVQYLTDLVTDLLELSRIESGLMPMMIEPVAAEKLVREVLARMLPLAQRHRVTLRTEIRQGTTMIAADSKQIVRVLVNLVHNAIKFTPSGGFVVIGSQLNEGEQTQQFFVRDTGVGIRPEELSRVFERFYKADRARSKTPFIGPGGGGSGLGLAIARHVVEAHGGRITVKSIIGQGSTFTFSLPVVV
jgi:two-component system, OmpR family, phosphate regulon sensor histidine kinase PhoR